MCLVTVIDLLCCCTDPVINGARLGTVRTLYAMDVINGVRLGTVPTLYATSVINRARLGTILNTVRHECDQ